MAQPIDIRFFFDQQRSTVGLSIAKDDVIIIGEADALLSSPIWHTHLSAVTQLTPTID